MCLESQESGSIIRAVVTSAAAVITPLFYVPRVRKQTTTAAWRAEQRAVDHPAAVTVGEGYVPCAVSALLVLFLLPRLLVLLLSVLLLRTGAHKLHSTRSQLTIA